MVETAIYLILFSLPFGYFLSSWRRPKASLSNILLGCYVYPLVLLTMLSAADYSPPNFSISPQTANPLRAAVHCVFAWWFIRKALKSRTRFRAVPGTIPALVAVGLMLLSTIFAGGGKDAYLRIALLLILLLNIFILIPTAVGDDSKRYYKELTRGAIFLALYLAGLSAIVIGLHGNFPQWSVRLGRPLNPGVLAVLLVFAFISAVFANRHLLVIGGLFVALVATGSRFPLAFAVVWLLIHWIKRASAWRRLGLALLICLGVGYVYWVQAGEITSDPAGIFERSDISSGRVLLWIVATNSIQTSPLWGRGDRTYLENVDTPEEEENIRSHNMLLENSMSYGIPASLAAFAVYLAMTLSAYRAWQNRHLLNVLYLAPMWLYFLAVQLAGTMVETTTWTNLGDGGNILLFLFVGPGLANAKAVLTARKKVQTQQLKTLRSASLKLPLNNSSPG